MTRKICKTFDSNGGSSWPYMFNDILCSIILQLGVIDFISFSCVCKSWRTIALLNKKKFMLTRQLMNIFVSARVAKKKQCYLVDITGRVFKTILPRSSCRTFFGVVSGYLILLGWKNHDFRLVNPITRHELHFPSFPFHGVHVQRNFRSFLACSSTMSMWVFVVFKKFSDEVSFSFSSEPTNWTHLSFDNPVCDLHFFQGMIYTLSLGMHLYAVKLNPTSTLTLLKMKNFTMSEFEFREFAILGEKLYGVAFRSREPHGTCEVDFEQMRWMHPRKLSEDESLEEYETCFNQMRWKKHFEEYDVCLFKRTPCMSFIYLPHECLEVNILHE